MKGGAVAFLMRIIPITFIGAFAQGDVLQVLLLAILFGAAISLLGEQAKPVGEFIERFSHILFKIMFFIDRLSRQWLCGPLPVL